MNVCKTSRYEECMMVLFDVRWYDVFPGAGQF